MSKHYGPSGFVKKPEGLILIAIDPGITGAVAVIDWKGNVISLQDTPSIKVKRGKHNRHLYLESQMVTLLENASKAGRVSCVGIENVHAMPGQGVTSMFSMGTGFGIWLGIIAALRLPVQRIEPARWKKEMGLGKDKSESIVKALQLYPTADLRRKADHNRAEALLLATYLLRRLQSPVTAE